MPKSCCQNDIVEGAACDSDVAGKYMFHDGCIVSKLFVILAESESMDFYKANNWNLSPLIWNSSNQAETCDR